MKIFCSGIGGIGLSAYAAYQHALGHEVCGSDRSDSDLLRDLRSQGIEVSLVQDGNAVPVDADLFVHTLALPVDHPELRKAVEFGIPQQTYFQALGDLTKGRKLIAVAGTHGKSSTTAMAAKVLLDAGLDFSVILGTKTPDLDGRNWRRGKGELFLVEACEYQRSFLHLSPSIILMTNVAGDHFDYYKDEEDYRSAFREFIGQLPKDGVLITHFSDPACAELVDTLKNAPGSVLSQVEAGACHILDADQLSLPKIQVPGQHMRQNAQLVLALAEHLGIPLKDAQKSLLAYRGCWRRSEIKGETKNGVLVIDDYGHHPNEVRVTLEGIKEAYPDRRLICVFQPHTHDRVLKLYDQFLTAFRAADLVIIPNIFAARSDRDSAKAEPVKLVKDIAKGSSVEAIHGESLEKTIELLKKEILKKGDLLVTMGAGDVWQVADEIL
jgi:UDP-N-acetylmuramate--alanine ligase